MANFSMGHNPHQLYLLPPSPDDWLPEDHLSYMVRDIVGMLDLSALTSTYSSDGRGAPAFSVAMMISIWFYGLAHGVYSCRKLARMCYEDVGARVLVGNHRPNFRCINDFRLRYGKAMDNLLLQSVALCKQAKMLNLIDLSIDGSRFMSYASKKGNIEYGRIDAEEARHLEFLRQITERANAEDAQDDAKYGADGDGTKSDTIDKVKNRVALLRQAKQILEAQAKADAVNKKRKYDEAAPGERPHIKRPDPETAVPAKTDQYNPVDPESRVQKSCQQGFIQGYNAQIAVDASSQVIVSYDLSNARTDVEYLTPMLEKAITNTQLTPERVLADAGYYSRKNVECVDTKGVMALIPPPLKKTERETKVPESLTDEQVAALDTKMRMRYLLAQQVNRKHYAKRMCSVETVFAHIKGSPGNMGYRRFLRRGVDKCKADWALLCCVHNFKKYWNHKMATAGA